MPSSMPTHLEKTFAPIETLLTKYIKVQDLGGGDNFPVLAVISSYIVVVFFHF